MENKPPGEDVDNIVTMPQREKSQDWSDLLAQLAETKKKTLYIELFKHFAPKVKAYIIRLGLVETTAEELMQETMLAVWRKAHMYNRSKAAASTWIFTLARNLSIDWMRKQKYPEYGLEEWHEEPDEHNPGEEMVTSDRLNRAIAQLPEKQAQVIYMSFFEGRSHSDISDRLGVPLGSVKSRIRLASEKLKTIWRDGV
ncbi:sigma-70 family RNA polymerase sigma factor [Neptuniibacter sp.]|uniref:sigma-70 family RNA polymerase sigma factor n=1 Tax=Neptuniibacter sp. TaxID=1962643 RepID=UPI00261E9C8E|nr:sigma-70 family RNA polymerase sigma factor [Neptuniibacter sp.]MCP4595503.1 sigma-70 family RNA polymerase sigma factor [Neptuniibacter sp.]